MNNIKITSWDHIVEECQYIYEVTDKTNKNKTYFFLPDDIHKNPKRESIIDFEYNEAVDRLMKQRSN